MKLVNNIFQSLPDATSQEQFTTLLQQPGIRLERIVSKGQRTADGVWYDQTDNEWVLLLQGRARLRFDDGSELTLKAGEYLHIQAHCRHRVEWTAGDTETIWLALHYAE